MGHGAHGSVPWGEDLRRQIEGEQSTTSPVIPWCSERGGSTKGFKGERSRGGKTRTTNEGDEKSICGRENWGRGIKKSEKRSGTGKAVEL